MILLPGIPRVFDLGSALAARSWTFRPRPSTGQDSCRQPAKIIVAGQRGFDEPRPAAAPPAAVLASVLAAASAVASLGERCGASSDAAEVRRAPGAGHAWRQQPRRVRASKPRMPIAGCGGSQARSYSRNTPVGMRVTRATITFAVPSQNETHRVIACEARVQTEFKFVYRCQALCELSCCDPISRVTSSRVFLRSQFPPLVLVRPVPRSRAAADGFTFECRMTDLQRQWLTRLGRVRAASIGPISKPLPEFISAPSRMANQPIVRGSRRRTPTEKRQSEMVSSSHGRLHGATV